MKAENYNLGQNTCRQNIFHVLAQIYLTTSETELDYHHQKVNILVPKQLKIRILGK